eukprot:COSAG02_NODE_1352_length_13107_cov_1461.050584_2_plen_1432_part_00
MQQPLFDVAESGGEAAAAGANQTANPVAADRDVAVATPKDGEDDKEPDFCCDFGCGFGHDSFQAVREHEHSCADRQRSTELGYSDVLTWSPVWRWRVHLLSAMLLVLLFELGTYGVVVFVASGTCTDENATFLYLQVTTNFTSLDSIVVGKPVTETNGVPGLVVRQNGDGQTGVTTTQCDGKRIRVAWEAGGDDAYRCGPTGATYDLQIASSDHMRLIRVPEVSSSQQDSPNSCASHADCDTGYYCDSTQTCYGCGYLQGKECDAFDDGCSVVTSAQCDVDGCVAGNCTRLTCAEAAARNDTMDCVDPLDDCDKDALGQAIIWAVLLRVVGLGVPIVVFVDPWDGSTTRLEVEVNKEKEANGEDVSDVSESEGRNPRYAKCFRRVCVGCPRLSPDRKPGARQPGNLGFLQCLRACHGRPEAVFDIAMLVCDEDQARVALSQGLDVHTDVLGAPKMGKHMNRALAMMWVLVSLGLGLFLLIAGIGVAVLFMQLLAENCEKCSNRRNKTEKGDETKLDDSAYEFNGQLGTARPANFVLPPNTASPLVLAVLGSRELFEAVLDIGGGAFKSVEQQQAALRLALLTDRRETARLIVASGQPGIEAVDAQGRTVLQYLASQLVNDEPDAMLSFCRGQGINRADFAHRTRTDGAWGRRVQRAMQLALDLGADPRGMDPDGKTPLYCAVQNASSCGEASLDLSVCSALLEHGADLHAEVNGDAGSHTTPAAIASNSEIATLREWSRTTGSYAGRFRLLDQLHQSETCVVFKGVDLERRRPHDAVAVKIMRKETEWNREVSARQDFHLDERHVVGVREAMRVDSAERRRRIRRQGTQGLVEYQSDDVCEFLLAMPLGECSLFDAISTERKVGRNVEWVRLAATHMGQCLQHLHQQGVVHSDVKPRNFCRFKDDNGSRLCLIDMDAASRIGGRMPEWGAGLKASTAYAPPELVTHILLGTTEPPISATSIDSWSFGCVLYELAAGLPLFNADRSDDNLNDATSKIELLNWRTIDNTRLARVFAECPACTDAQRSAVQNLIAWCLQADASLRPSMEQVLGHRFISIDAPTPAPVPSASHFFLSHFQKEAADLVRSLYLMLKECGCSCWLDMEADNLTLEGMRNGVETSQCFMLVLTHGVLFRPYCIEEIFVAAKLEKDVVLVCETEARFHAFNYDEWSSECKTSKQYAWCLAELAKVEGRGEAAAAHMMETVACMIDSNKEHMIPYRRRNFESNAMIAAILARNGLHSISSLSSPDDLLRVQSVPVGGLTHQVSPYARVPSAPASLAAQSVYVAIVHSTPAGDEAAASLRHSLRGRGLSVGGVDAARKARRLLIVLTDGSLKDPAVHTPSAVGIYAVRDNVAHIWQVSVFLSLQRLLSLEQVLAHLRNAVRQEGLSRQRSVAEVRLSNLQTNVLIHRSYPQTEILKSFRNGVMFRRTLTWR